MAAGAALTLLSGPLALSARAQNVGGEIVKVLGGSKSRQGEKNAMRNLGIGLGGAALYEGINHRGTSALVLGAGAVLAGKKYEDARKAQAKENRAAEWHRDYRYRNGERIGYYSYKGDHKVAYYQRLHDSDGDWRNAYKYVRGY